MRYIILPTDEAEAINRQEAINRGCEDGVTKYWFAMTPNYDGTLTALYVNDNYNTTLDKLTALPEGFTDNNK